MNRRSIVVASTVLLTFSLATVAMAGQEVGSQRSVISKDGRTMTVSQKGKNAAGQDVLNVLIYDKQ